MYNNTDTCDKIKEDGKICGKDFHGKAFKEKDIHENWKCKWICRDCQNLHRREIYKKLNPKMPKTYNKTNLCDRCNVEKLRPNNAYHELDEKRNKTGKWLCKKCYTKDYHKIPCCGNALKKQISNWRICNLDPNSPSGKAFISEQIVCKTRGLDNLNMINDDFKSPFDHSSDLEYGIIQTKMSTYSPIYKRWQIESDKFQEFDNIIAICMDKDMKNVARVYIFPRFECIERMHISICINPPWIPWYEKYRIDERPYNDTYHNLNKDDLKGLRL